MLTSVQATTLKAAILADATANAARLAGDMGAIAAYYNAPGAGSIWRPGIPSAELNTAIIWSEYATLTTALMLTYQVLISGGSVDATNANIRTGFATVFAGKTTLANLSALAARVPTRFEALFAANNVTTVFGQTVSVADVAQALIGT